MLICRFHVKFVVKMKILYCLYFFALLNLAVCEEVGMRKIGYGEGALLKEFPFVANVKTYYRVSGSYVKDLCTGSYVHPHWILTAGHCVRKDTKVEWTQVCMGVEWADYCEPINNNRYVEETHFSTDKLVIMMRIGQQFYDYHGTKRIKVGRLPTPEDINKDFTGQNCTALGWGDTESNRDTIRLMKAYLEVKLNQCNGTQFLCAADPEMRVCGEGDAGGPLVCGGIIIGVLQNGTKPEDCALKSSEALYVRVVKYLDFIRNAIDGKYSSKATNKTYSILCLFISVIINLNCLQL